MESIRLFQVHVVHKGEYGRDVELGENKLRKSGSFGPASGQEAAAVKLSIEILNDNGRLVHAEAVIDDARDAAEPVEVVDVALGHVGVDADFDHMHRGANLGGRPQTSVRQGADVLLSTTFFVLQKVAAPMPATEITTVPYTSLSDDELDALKAPEKNTLFNNVGCPFSHRAFWTAAEVDAPVRVVEVGLHAEMPASYPENFNRYRTVPFLLDSGYPVYESAIVAYYLDAKYNQGQLHNRDSPQEATLSKLLADKFEVSPLFGLLMASDPEAQKEALAKVQANLSELERIYREHAAAYRAKGPYLLGDKLSVAEIHTVPFFYRLSLGLSHYRKIVLFEGFPLLAAAYEAAIDRPAFKLTVREPEFYINVFSKFVKY
ncbi:hypothetical protein ACHHYP_04758 [Achlya hypogyna]|uniref:Glutathione S-transferase n=1 Tax=Achlya hypogyna TaxID=1202772 RepID=A0A1V9Z035_ACHHY|nr:hypothetical protein ACHHYP_04758 [Achlya hypogyna]